VPLTPLRVQRRARPGQIGMRVVTPPNPAGPRPGDLCQATPGGPARVLDYFVR